MAENPKEPAMASLFTNVTFMTAKLPGSGRSLLAFFF